MFGNGFQFARHAGRQWSKQLLFAIDEIGSVEGGQFEAVSVGDRVGGASFDTVSAEDAAIVVDVVNRGVTLGAADAILGGVLGGLDIDTVRWTCGSAQEAGDALL